MGYITNWAGIKVMFEPIVPWRGPSWLRDRWPLRHWKGFQGLFLTRQAEVSAEFAQFMSQEVRRTLHTLRYPPPRLIGPTFDPKSHLGAKMGGGNDEGRRQLCETRKGPSPFLGSIGPSESEGPIMEGGGQINGS